MTTRQITDPDEPAEVRAARRNVHRHELIYGEGYDIGPCLYGHYGCSCTKTDGGPCLDEELGIIELFDDERGNR